MSSPWSAARTSRPHRERSTPQGRASRSSGRTTRRAARTRPCRPRRAAPTMGVMPDPARRVLLAKPRGYCAGVDRAVQTVERALEKFGAPVYVRKQIVHNVHVVRDLEKRGAVFVEEAEEVP